MSANSHPPHRILILVDSTQRDLPGHMLLKRILETKFGCEVRLASTLSPRTEARIFRPHATVLPMMYDNLNKRFAYYLKSKEVLVFFLTTEGYPNVPDDDFVDYLAGRYSDFRPVDMNFTWCREIAERGVRYGVLPADKIFVSGLPRFDFYHKTFDKTRLSRDAFILKYSLNPEYPIVTWVSNFPGVRLTVEQLSRGIEQTNTQHIKAYNNAEKTLINETVSLKRTVGLLEQWIAGAPKINFVIRPHPLDDWGFFDALAKSLKERGLKYVVSAPEGPIFDILSSTDILIQRACTTAVEAFLLEIPVIELRLNENELLTQPDRDDCVDLCLNAKDFERKIDDYLQTRKVSLEMEFKRRRYVEKWFFKVDGHRTYDMAAKMYEALLSHTKKPLFSRAERLFGHMTSLVRKCKFTLGLRNKFRDKSTYMTKKDQKFWQTKIDDSGVLDQFDAIETIKNKNRSAA